MNSTERLQQIFNNKPVKQKPRNIIYSNEMVKDLTDIIKYPINDIRFHLKMNEIEESIEMLSMSLENLYKDFQQKGKLYLSLNEHSTEMAKFYLHSMEGPDVKAMGNKVVDTIKKILQKIKVWVLQGFRKFTNWGRHVAAKKYVKTYDKWQKNGKKLSGTVKTKRIVKQGAYGAVQDLIMDKSGKFRDLQKAINGGELTNDSLADEYLVTSDKKEKQGSANEPDHFLKNYVSPNENGEIEATAALGNDVKNIEFISPEFINQRIKLLYKRSQELNKLTETTFKQITKHMNDNSSRLKNLTNKLKIGATETNSLISAIITVCGVVNGIVSQGLGGGENAEGGEAPKDGDNKQEAPSEGGGDNNS